MYMGKPVSRRMLSAVLRLCGHPSTGPTAVSPQSMDRMRAPIAPPPSSALRDRAASRSFGVREETELKAEEYARRSIHRRAPNERASGQAQLEKGRGIRASAPRSGSHFVD